MCMLALSYCVLVVYMFVDSKCRHGADSCYKVLVASSCLYLVNITKCQVVLFCPLCPASKVLYCLQRFAVKLSEGKRQGASCGGQICISLNHKFGLSCMCVVTTSLCTITRKQTRCTQSQTQWLKLLPTRCALALFLVTTSLQSAVV